MTSNSWADKMIKMQIDLLAKWKLSLPMLPPLKKTSRVSIPVAQFFFKRSGCLRVTPHLETLQLAHPTLEAFVPLQSCLETRPLTNLCLCFLEGDSGPSNIYALSRLASWIPSAPMSLHHGPVNGATNQSWYSSRCQLWPPVHHHRTLRLAGAVPSA